MTCPNRPHELRCLLLDVLCRILDLLAGFLDLLPGFLDCLVNLLAGAFRRALFLFAGEKSDDQDTHRQSCTDAAANPRHAFLLIPIVAQPTAQRDSVGHDPNVTSSPVISLDLD